MSVDWNNLQKDAFVTASWDQTVKVVSVRGSRGSTIDRGEGPMGGEINVVDADTQWALERTTSLNTIPAHSAQIFAAKWCPSIPTLIATTGADGYLNLFDIRSPVQSQRVAQTQISPADVLDLDWNKYDTQSIAVAKKDGAVGIWDMRGQRQVGECRGHRLAVRKVAWSPHHRDVLASTSYDMTCRT